MLFVSSKSAVNRHGVFAVEIAPPAAIKAIGTGVVGFVGQFPWGPDQELTIPDSWKAATDMFCPPGFDRNSTGYMALAGKGWPSLRIVRALPAAAVKASIALTAAGPTTIVTATAKYKGTAGNGITCVVSAADDADSNHFNLTVTKTGTSGTTVDTLRNLNFSGVGSDSVVDFTKLKLLGALTKSNSGRPVNGTYTMASGADGSIVSSDYIGTAGTADKGIALLEKDLDIGVVVTDDSGNTLRAAVNAGLVAHAILMGDRLAVISGNSGLSTSAVRTDVANYRSSDRIVYVDLWYKKYDESGVKQLTYPAPIMASVIAQISPSTSPGWKAKEVREMLREIVELESDRGESAGGNTDQGIATLIKEVSGGFTFEAGVLTYAAVDITKKNVTRRRMADYIAKSVTLSLREITDSPNVEENQTNVVSAIDAFLSGLKRAKSLDPNHTPHILDYKILPVSETNTQADLDAGEFTVQADIKTSSAMEKIFFAVRLGETVQITAT